MLASTKLGATRSRRLGGRLTVSAALVCAHLVCAHLAADEPRTLKGHSEAAYDLAFFPDASRLVSAGFDHTLRLWDLQTLKPTRTFSGHSDLVLCVAVSRDGSRVASGALDQTIRLWDVPNDHPLQVLEDPSGDVQALAVSAEGDLYASCGADRVIRIRKTDDNSLVSEIKGLPVPASHLAFRPDGAVLAAGDAQGRIIHYNTKDGAILAVVGAHQGPVTGLAYSRLGDFLLSTGYDGLIKQWYATPRHWTGITTTDQRELGQASRPLEGHKQPILAVASTRDGTVVATAAADKTIRLWNQKTGQMLRELTGHEGAIEAMTFTADDSELVSGSADKTVRIFNVSDGTSREAIRMPGAVTAVATIDGTPSIVLGDATGALRVVGIPGLQSRSFAGHKSAIAGVGFVKRAEAPEQVVSAADKAVKIWDFKTGELVRTIDVDAKVHDVSISRGGYGIALACEDKTVRLFDVQSGELARTLDGHTGKVRTVCFEPSGRQLVSAGDDGTVRLWDAGTGRELQRVYRPQKDHSAACIVPGRSEIFSLDSDNAVQFDPIQIMAAPQVDESGHVHALAISLANRTQFLTAGDDGHIRQWNLGGTRPYRVYSEHKGPALSVAISPTSYFASGGKDGIIQIFRTTGRTGALRRIYVGTPIKKLVFSNDNRKLVAVGADNRIRTYDPTGSRSLPRVSSRDEKLTDPEALQVLSDHSKTVNDLALGPDSKTLFSASSDGTIRKWTVAGADGLALPKGHTSAIYGLDFSPDGKSLVSASADKSVKVWSLDNYKSRPLGMQEGAVYSVRYSPDGKTILTAGADASVRLLDEESGRELQRFAGPTESMYSAVFSSDGKQVAAAGTGPGKQRAIFVWKTSQPQTPLELVADMDDVYRVQFNKPGSRLMAVGYGGRINIWDLASKKVVFISKLPSSLFAAAYSPDGKQIAAAGNDGTVFLIDVPENAR